MYKQLENNCSINVIQQFMDYAREVVENDPESHVDFENLDFEDVYSSILSSLYILLECYNTEKYTFEGDLENDLFLCKSDVFSGFVNNLETTDELSEDSWDKIKDKLYELLGITGIEKMAAAKIEADKHSNLIW